MTTQATVAEMQDAIMTIRRFVEYNDCNLCRPYLKDMVRACADLLDTILVARDWEPVMPDE